MQAICLEVTAEHSQNESDQEVSVLTEEENNRMGRAMKGVGEQLEARKC